MTSPMARAPAAKLVIPSKLSEVAGVQSAIMGQVESQGYPQEATFGIRLALEEALTNAIRHGNRSDPSRNVTIEYSVNDVEARIKICDEGCGFKASDVPDPTLDENLCRPHGRGVMLMRAYMTSVRFNKAGNCVTLVKKRDCAKQKRREKA